MIAQLAAVLSGGGLRARREAVESLFDAAEEGEDLTMALSALGGALSDVDTEIRECAGETLGYLARTGAGLEGAIEGLVDALADRDLALVAGECIQYGLKGADRDEMMVALEAGLSGAPLQQRNVAGLLVRGWLAGGAPERVVGLLSDPRDLIRQGVCEAAVAAVREGASPQGLASALEPRLLDTAVGVARRAAWLLGRADPERVPALLSHSRTEVRLGVLASLAEGCDDGVMPTGQIAVILARLVDSSSSCRQKAAYVLVALARSGAEMSEAVVPLGAALSDPVAAVKDEAVLALLWLVRSGRDVAAANLPAHLETAGVGLRRTAAMVWGRHLLNIDDTEGIEALLTGSERHVRFGAVWGMTERHLVRHDAAAILILLQRDDRLIGEAVVSTMRQFREEGRNVSAGLTAFHLLQQGGLMGGARAQGLFAEFLR